MDKTPKAVLTILAVIVIVGGLLYLLWGGLEKNIVYFVTPSELLAKGEGAVGNPIRLGGVVTEKIEYRDTLLSFELADELGKKVPVVTTKAPPQMFQKGIGVVVEGALEADGRFHAERVMVRHSNEYKPPAEGEIPQEIYKSLHKK